MLPWCRYILSALPLQCACDLPRWCVGLLRSVMQCNACIQETSHDTLTAVVWHCPAYCCTAHVACQASGITGMRPPDSITQEDSKGGKPKGHFRNEVKQSAHNLLTTCKQQQRVSVARKKVLGKMTWACDRSSSGDPTCVDCSMRPSTFCIICIIH